jgi:hypothetical protein
MTPLEANRKLVCDVNLPGYVYAVAAPSLLPERMMNFPETISTLTLANEFEVVIVCCARAFPPRRTSEMRIP